MSKDKKKKFNYGKIFFRCYGKKMTHEAKKLKKLKRRKDVRV